MREYLKVLFNPIDNEHFVDKKTDGDGNEIEPNSLIPILPLLVINGQNQIGVGFATKVLPRDPKVIINLIKDILEKKTTNIPSNIAPWYWCFTGTIEPVLNSSSWNINGLWSRGKNNTIIITEVPFKYDRDGYLKLLNDLKEPQVVRVIKTKKGEPKLEITPIISYKENINKNSFYLEVKVDKLIYDLPDNKLEDFLSLTSSESEFFTIIDEKNEIVSIENIGIYLYNFIKWRLGVYAKRKAYLLKKMKDDIQTIKEIVRFINLVNDNVIIIHKQSKANLITQIENNQFQPIDGSFNYVLNVKIYELTSERVIDYLAEVDKLQQEHDRLEKVAISELWLEDIKKFEALFFKKEKVLKVLKPEKLEKPEKKTRTKKGTI
jgi:DNA topoisomerase-2